MVMYYSLSTYTELFTDRTVTAQSYAFLFR